MRDQIDTVDISTPAGVKVHKKTIKHIRILMSIFQKSNIMTGL